MNDLVLYVIVVPILPTYSTSLSFHNGTSED